jgi:hypothetical protein
MSASGGSGGPDAGVPAAPSCAVPGRPASATESTSFLQRDQKAAVNSRAANAAVRSGRKTYTTLETSLRKFKAMNNRCLQFRGKHANAGDDQLIRIDCHFDEFSAYTRQSDEDADLPLSFQDINGRLPGRQTRGGLNRPEELAMQPLRAGQHFARLRPHPIARMVTIHGSRLSVGCKITSSAQFRASHSRISLGRAS